MGRGMEQEKRTKKKIGNIFFIVLNVAIIGFMVYKEFFSGEAAGFSDLVIDWRYLLPALSCFLVMVLAEGAKFGQLIFHTAGKRDIGGGFAVGILGRYYDNITPMGSGGQPFQMHYLHKRGYDSGTSGSIPMAGFISSQLVFVLIALVVLIVGRASITDTYIKITAWVGLVMYAFLPVCAIVFAIWPSALHTMIAGPIRFLGRHRILKNPEDKVQKVIHSVSSTAESMRMIGSNWKLLIHMIITSVLFRIALMSIPYFVLHFFGVNASYLEVFFQVTFITASMTIIPTPGNSGAAEVSFYLVFSSLAGDSLFWAITMWRVLCYYSWLAIGLVYIMVKAFHKERKTTETQKPEAGSWPATALFADKFYPNIDGVVNTVDAYARHLVKKTDCCVICPTEQVGYKDKDDYPVIRTASLILHYFKVSLAMPFLSHKAKKHLKNGNYRIFHAHAPFAMGHFALYMGKKLHIPVIATFHSKFYDDAMQITKSRFLAGIVKRHVVSYFSKVDEVWACSSGTAETLRSYGYKGNIVVMDNGIDENTDNEEEMRANAIETFKLPQDRKILLFVGQVIWQKGLKLVLDTLANLKKDHPEYMVVIAGTGYYMNEVRQYVEKLGLNDDVMFLGKISDRKLLKGVYLASDLFFFPSLYDNTPLVLREAAQMGLPALLVTGSNAAEAVTDGQNGFTAENDCAAMTAKILDIFSSDLKTVSENARKTIPVSWSTITERVVKEYNRVIEEYGK
ncbi:MAG: flippase-like domain-containing protein [Spirochaetales bacterium]|nr:flippase-like domain-containing protein [Spirochaetales bacterium]